MLSLRPDFLFAYGDFDYGGKHPGIEGLATLDELNTAGVQVYTVVCPDEAGDFTGETLEATYRTILDLGKIFGVSDRVEKRVAAMKVAGKQVDAFVIWTDFKEGTHTLDGAKEAQFLFGAFPNMQASKDRRVALTAYTYTNPGWRVAQTVEDIARQLHPDAFK